MNLDDLLSQKLIQITADSRQVRPGAVFVAIPGTQRDGTGFISDAISRGARFVVSEAPVAPPLRGAELIRVDDARSALAQLAAHFYNHPSRKLHLAGVTGTSGKTTTTYLVEAILKAAGHKTGVIGTVSFRYGEKVIPASHTTPDATELQRLLAEMRDAGCTAVVMEVSSHALAQNRIGGTAFDAVAFTNLSPEHQDFHPDMEHYYRSKARLFTEAMDYSTEQGKRPGCAINLDDPYGKRLFNELTERQADRSGKFRLIPFTIQATQAQETQVPEAMFTCDLTGIRGTLCGVRVESPLIGRFNAENIATAVAVAHGLGLSTEAIQRGIRSLALVPGRLERVSDPEKRKNIHVFVDYAHKPDALEKVLHTLRESLRCSDSNRQLLTVFGCGGDRDRKKRPMMGEIAMRLSDLVWITSDNPRTEDPNAIIGEIASGARRIPGNEGKLHIQPDRRTAILESIQSAREGDVVVIAGKGHEDYQIIADPQSPGGTRKIHFDDREIALEALHNRSIT